MTIVEAAALLRSRRISSSELVAQTLRNIERENPRINAFLTVTAEHAASAARRADEELARGIDRGPLQGVPYALKDVFCTRGIRTTCGSLLFQDFVPDRDAAVTERLSAAGAVLVGKTGLHELAYGITSGNPHFGPVLNPRDLTRIPGGSSGGSGAAVAAGLVPFAMGSDTGGSIRIPAAFCGTVGLKPTSGRVSRYGVMPLDFSLDHMGPRAGTVTDAALVLNAIAGHDRRDDTSSQQPIEDYAPPEAPSLSGLRVGRPRNFYFDRLHPAVAEAAERAFERAASLGARVMEVTVPDIAAINVVGRVILMSEASALLDNYMEHRDRFGPDVLALLDQGRLLPATDYINAQRLRRRMQQEFSRIWSEIDILITPTAPVPAPKVGATTVEIDGVTEDTRMAATRFVRAINVLGLPALSVPAGQTNDGLPVGIQLIGKPFEEAQVLQTGVGLQETLTNSKFGR